MSNKIDIRDLYRLPWSKNDNPNGWIEITTYCNISCPGCYRGCDRTDNTPRHKSIDDIKKEILDLIAMRNCQTISISGGEPLMHPGIIEILFFIDELGLNTLLLTNGTLLTEEILLEMKSAGLTGLLIRIDSLKANSEESEIMLNKLRKKYADLVYKVGDIFLGFSCVISQKNLNQIPDVIDWIQANPKKVDFLLLILKREVIFENGRRLDTNDWVYLPELIDVISKPDKVIVFSGYLGSQAVGQDIKWLYSFWISHNNKRIDFFDKKLVELLHVFHHFRKGKYFFILKKKQLTNTLLYLILSGVINKSARKIVRKYITGFFTAPWEFTSRLNVQTLNIVNPPGNVEGKRDLCDACPDALLYKGNLYPSCCLEEIKRFGEIVEFDDDKT
ncbi:radical SAM protein [Mangrovibacterium lignilyticum]|uniref:radical SAM protein n=1 Tax=Mangrovibacterium lignilyticum TaxID=2668052 RepID=UPI0013D7FC2D|nr:radical SAM protein [Mangrovibacterium lignilyticum]